MWLGHHSPAFTLATYVHLVADDLPDPDFLDALTGEGGNKVATGVPENGRDPGSEGPSETAFFRDKRDPPRSPGPAFNPKVAGSNPARPILMVRSKCCKDQLFH